MTNVSARSILVNFFRKKNLTPNGPKPIGVLTRTKSSHSDLRIPYCYLLSNFQPNWSNFFAPPPPPPPPVTRKEGGRHLGGLRPPKPPRGGSCQWQFWFVIPNMPQTLSEICFLCVKKKIIRVVFPYDFCKSEIIHSYPQKHYKDPLESFWAISDDYLER